jgi:hypothetical protein
MNVTRPQSPRVAPPPEQQREEPLTQGVEAPLRPAVEPVRETEPELAVELKKDTYTENPADAAEWASRYAASSLKPAQGPDLSKMEEAPSISDRPASGAKGWTQPTPVMQQTDATNCGATAAAMLVRAAGGGQGQTDAELVKGLESKYSDAKGTTPDQMGQMLAGQGFEVTRGAANLDRDALNGALDSGKKAVALVDSNLIQPGTGANAPGGSAHWVEIDGRDAQGNYRVNDPATGSSYDVGLHQLTNAMNSGWSSFDGGGMLIVQPGSTDAASLTNTNANHSGTLGDSSGIGSKNSAAGSRESGS